MGIEEFDVGIDARIAVDGVGDEAGERVDAQGFGCEGVDVADGGAGRGAHGGGIEGGGRECGGGEDG